LLEGSKETANRGEKMLSSIWAKEETSPFSLFNNGTINGTKVRIIRVDERGANSRKMLVV
jgi:hypothetical protein